MPRTTTSYDAKCAREERIPIVNKMRQLLQDVGSNPMSETQRTEFEKLNSAQEGLLRKAESIEKIAEMEDGGDMIQGDGYEIGKPTFVNEKRQDKVSIVPANVPMLRYCDAQAYHKQVRSECTPEEIEMSKRINLGDVIKGMYDNEYRASNPWVKRAMVEGTDALGGYTTPTILGLQVIDAMVEASKVLQCGAVVMPLNQGGDGKYHDFCALDTIPSVEYLTEGSTGGDTDFNIRRVRFTPKTARLMIKFSQELLEDSRNLSEVLTLAIGHSFAASMDQVALTGATSLNQPLGLLNSTSIGSTGAGSTDGQPVSTVRYSPLITAGIKNLLERNVPFEKISAFLMRTNVGMEFANLADSQNQPLQIPPILANIPLIYSNRLPTNEGVHGIASTSSSTTCSSILVGDWSQFVYGMRTALTLQPIRERYIDQFSRAMFCYFRLDCNLWNNNALFRIHGWDPNATT